MRTYLDYASITPVAPEVTAAMKPYLEGTFANPSSLYEEGRAAREALETARQDIADMLTAVKSEIVFTASGTESNNLALLGVFESLRRPDFVPHIVTTEIEHPAILDVCAEIKRRGGEVTIVPVSADGVVSPADIMAAVQENTVLVSVMYANNEIGTIQPVHEIVQRVKRYRREHGTQTPYVHTDASQAALYLDIDVQKLGVDLMTLDGIKMYGPRAAALLYVRRETPLQPVLFGGGQEGGLRSGTEYVAGAVGLAAALRLALSLRESECERLSALRDTAITRILDAFPGSELNGSATERLPSNINICFPGLDAEFAVVSLDVHGIAAAYSSSCRTLKENSSSYVVAALGKPQCAESSLRFTFGRGTTAGDIDRLVQVLQRIVK